MATRLDTVGNRSAVATMQQLHTREERITASKSRIQVEKDVSTAAELTQHRIEAAQQLLSRERESGKHMPTGRANSKSAAILIQQLV